jgi:hypothetical protein
MNLKTRTKIAIIVLLVLVLTTTIAFADCKRRCAAHRYAVVEDDAVC